MPFESLPEGHGFRRPPLKNTVSIAKSANAAGASFFISRDLYKKLGEPAFVRLFMGNGEHTGFVLVSPAKVKADGNTFKINTTSPNSAAKFGISPRRLGIAQKSFPVTDCQHEMVEEGIVVDVRGFYEPALAAAE